MCETVGCWARFIDGVVVVITVIADRRTAKQDGWGLVGASDATNQLFGQRNAAGEECLFPMARPARSENRRTGQVNDGVEAGDGRR